MLSMAVSHIVNRKSTGGLKNVFGKMSVSFANPGPPSKKDVSHSDLKMLKDDHNNDGVLKKQAHLDSIDIPLDRAPYFRCGGL